MPATTTVAEPAAPTTLEPELLPAPESDPLVTDELLVEEISIDGMCGVY
jgi:mycofactocin precursor